MTLLDSAQGYKPLDFGGNSVTGSVDRDGRIIALNTVHPTYGCITLTSAEPFDDAHRYDSDRVRAYRRGLVDLDGYGLHFDARIVRREHRLLHGAIPQIRLDFAGGGSAEVTTIATGRGAFQFWEIDRVQAVWRGRFGWQRCAYTQITEGNPLPAPPLEMAITFTDGQLQIYNPHLDRTVVVAGGFTGDSWSRHVSGLAEAELAFDRQRGTITLIYEIFAGPPDPFDITPPEVAAGQRDETVDYWDRLMRDFDGDAVTRRGLAYSVMTAVRVTGSETDDNSICLLTDHMLLPLAWTRDAYYVALLLLHTQSATGHDLVRDHLRWTFNVAQRPDGSWGRSYLANGAIKDPAFQFDQQLYPLLELADYLLMVGDESPLPVEQTVGPVLDMLLTRKATGAMLFPTDETPGDDPIPLPYHLSSHVLLWRTLTRLNELTGTYGDMAGQVRRAIYDHFVVEHDGRTMFAYATDGQGQYHFYHDANDVPLALAPAWGFCPADDPVWRATVAFAFSPGNVGGFDRGHLGSVHSPGAWTLGDIQDMIVARALGDEARVERARTALHRAAQWDGALPESYDPDSGAVISRTWFAWPNALYTCFQRGVFDV